MARRKAGIPQEALDRIRRELEDLGYYRVAPPTPEEPERNYDYEEEEEKDLSSLSVEQLCKKLDIDYEMCFGKYEPVLTLGAGGETESSRIRAMQFEVGLSDDYEGLDLKDILIDMILKDAVPYTDLKGSVLVEWVNRPRGVWHWEYYDVKLGTYMKFRTAASPGKFLNENAGDMPSHSPYAG